MPDYVVEQLEATTVGACAIKLCWQPPSGVIAAIKYIVSYSAKTGGKKTVLNPEIDTSVTIDELEPCTGYTFSVIVTTAMGQKSTEKAEVECSTGAGVPTCVPSNVSGEFNASAYTIGKSGSYNVAVDLHWTCDDVGNNIVSGYRICFREEGTAAESAQTKDVAGVGTRQCTVDQLQGHAAYVFTVAACNAAGAGPPSREMVLKTAEQNDHAMFQLRKVTSPSKDAPAATTAPAVTTTGTDAKAEKAEKKGGWMNKFKLKKSAEADKGNKEDTKKAKAAADKKHSAPPKGTVETGGTAAEAVSAEQAREAERQQMERWESNRVGHAPAPSADTMTGGDADPTPARSGTPTAEEQRELERQRMEAWEHSKVASAGGKAATITPSKAPPQLLAGGATLGKTASLSPGMARKAAPTTTTTTHPPPPAAKTTASQASTTADTVAAAERRRQEEAAAAAAWEQRVGGDTAAVAAPTAADTPNETPNTDPGADGGRDGSELTAEQRRQAEIDAAAAWESKTGAGTATIKNIGTAGEMGSLLSKLSSVELHPTTPGDAKSPPQIIMVSEEERAHGHRPSRKESDSDGAAPASSSPDAPVGRRPSVMLTQAPPSIDVSVDDAELKREHEKRMMEKFENRIGAGGKVHDLVRGESLEVDTVPLRVPLKDGSADGKGGGLGVALRQSSDGARERPRSASFGATLNPAIPAMGAIQRTRSIGNVTDTNAAPKKDTPISRAMAQFMDAHEMEDMLVAFERTRSLAGVEATGGQPFFDEFRQKVAPQLDYKRGHLLRTISKKRRKYDKIDQVKKLPGLKIVVVGCGPVGLRAAIEFAFLGADVTVVEMRTTFSRYNILHLWDWVCHDLLELGVSNSEILGKSFYHVGTKQLQLLLAKLALCVGVRLHSGVKFVKAVEPTTDRDLWKIDIAIDKQGFAPHCPKHLDANVLVEAGGISGPVVQSLGFDQKRVKMSTALGLVAHFEVSSADRGMEEFSVSSQFKQEVFKKLRDKGLHLENVVYYQGETHYYVMTPTTQSLKSCGVFQKVFKNPGETVASSNINYDKLHDFAREVATYFGLPPTTPFIKDRCSAQLFDFSSRSQCKVSCKVLEDKKNERKKQLLVLVVGDALIEPFWPEGLGLNRGFLSALDAAYSVQEFFSEGQISKENTKKLLKQKDKLFNMMRCLSAHTKKDTLREDFRSYTLHPNSRYLKWKTGHT